MKNKVLAMKQVRRVSHDSQRKTEKLKKKIRVYFQLLQELLGDFLMNNFG